MQNQTQRRRISQASRVRDAGYQVFWQVMRPAEMPLYFGKTHNQNLEACCRGISSCQAGDNPNKLAHTCGYLVNHVCDWRRLAVWDALEHRLVWKSRKKFFS